MCVGLLVFFSSLEHVRCFFQTFFGFVFSPLFVFFSLGFLLHVGKKRPAQRIRVWRILTVVLFLLSRCTLFFSLKNSNEKWTQEKRSREESWLACDFSECKLCEAHGKGEKNRGAATRCGGIPPFACEVHRNCIACLPAFIQQGGAWRAEKQSWIVSLAPFLYL